jgi:putative SOS response-associated peptidase YedK
VPATGFYEWTKDADGNRLPWYFTPADGQPLVFAGIWQAWDKGETAPCDGRRRDLPASPWMAETHHREPVSLAPGDWAKWLGEDGKGAATLMRPRPRGATPGGASIRG